MATEQVTTLCMQCGARAARVVATGVSAGAEAALLCGTCAIEDRAGRMVIGAPVPIYAPWSGRAVA
jgi:hypothetical protein